MTTPYRARLVGKRKTVFAPTDDASYAWRACHSVYCMLPGLVGFWPMSGLSWDFIDNFSYLLLTNHGGQAPTTHDLRYAPSDQDWDVLGFSGLVPYATMRGPNGYGRIGNLVIYSIQGIAPREDHIIAGFRGLTLGLWVQFTNTGTAEGLIGKDNGLSYTYYIERTSGDYIRFVVYSGTPASVTNAVTVDDQGWYLIIGRWTPSTDLCLFVNGVKTTQAGGPASLTDSDAHFMVGGATQTAAGTADKLVSMAFICSMTLSDAMIQNIWYQTKAMFGR